MSFNFKYKRINQLALLLMLVIILMLTINNYLQGQEAIVLQMDVRDRHSVLLNEINDLHQSMHDLHTTVVAYREQKNDELENLAPIIHEFVKLVKSNQNLSNIESDQGDLLLNLINKVQHLIGLYIDEYRQYQGGDADQKLKTLLLEKIAEMQQTLYSLSHDSSYNLKNSGLWFLQTIEEALEAYTEKKRVDKDDIELLLNNVKLNFSNFRSLIGYRNNDLNKTENEEEIKNIFSEYTAMYKYYVVTVPNFLYIDEDNEVTQDDIDNINNALDDKWYELQYQIKNLRISITNNLKYEISRTIEVLKSNQVASLFAAILAVLLFFVAMIILNQILSNRLRILKQGASHFSQGRLSEKIILNTNDEFSELAGHFNDMSEQLAKREDQLVDINESLEQRIILRTKELEVSRDAAEKANQAKSNFLSTMSHEIRTPMNGVIGMLELLQRTKLQNDQIRFMTTASDSANNLLDLINEILDFSKIESDQLNIEIRSFNIINLVVNSIGLLSEAARKNNTELLCDIDTDLPVYVMGDPMRLRQILINLVANAVKFTSNGEVILRCTKSLNQHEYVNFSIEDTGIGIHKDAQAVLFDAFTQADGTITREYGGTGLGLAISQRLTQLMGDSIKIDSEPGKGSRFYFDLHLPTAKSQLEDISSKGSNHNNIKHIHVLLVDDNQSSLDVLSAYLTFWGLSCDKAGNADDAIKLCHDAEKNKHPYNLALLDQIMPEVDGLKLAQLIKQDDNISEFPLVLLSCSAMLSSEVKKLGFMANLSKPVHLSSFYDVICRYFDPAYISKLKSLAKGVKSKFTIKGHILLVDDHEINRMMAETFLTQMGASVVQVENGEEAVACWKKEHFDLILMDIQMPVMDGYEATRKIRALEGLNTSQQATPIIAMTANVLSDDKKATTNAGMDDYLPKPFSWNQMEDILTKWLTTTDSNIVSDQSDTNKPVTQISSTEILDEERIVESIQSLGEHFNKMVDMTMNSVSASLDIMRQAIEADDVNQLGREAHKLKGAIGTMGAVEMMELCRTIEDHANDNNIEGAKDQYDLLPDVYDKYITALKNLIKQTSDQS